jgi:hypothetical protein
VPLRQRQEIQKLLRSLGTVALQSPRKNKICGQTLLSYIANVLQLGKNCFNPPVKSALAVLLIGVVLLLNALAASPALHKLIHHDADKADHDCAVTMFAHGHVDSVAVEVSVVAPAFFIPVIPQVKFSAFAPAIKNLPPGRAPPGLPAVS